MATIFAIAAALPIEHELHHIDHHAPAHYDFSYAVHDPHTGDVKDQHESRQGDAVKGHYSLVEPDGHRRTVHYTSDAHNGFNAVVSRDGHGHHAAPVAHHVAPVIAHHATHHIAPVAIAHHHAIPVHGGATSHQSVSHHSSHGVHY